MLREWIEMRRLCLSLVLAALTSGSALAGGDGYVPPDFDRHPPEFEFAGDPPPPREPREAPYDKDYDYPPRPGEALAGAWLACNEDARRYCYDVLPGRGRIVRCLIFNWDRLRPVCREGMQRARDALRY